MFGDLGKGCKAHHIVVLVSISYTIPQISFFLEKVGMHSFSGEASRMMAPELAVLVYFVVGLLSASCLISVGHMIVSNDFLVYAGTAAPPLL